jgi:hypothetical protein
MASNRRLLIKLGKIREQITNTEESIDKLTMGDRQGVSEYRTDTDVGFQQTKYRSLKELKDLLDRLESDEQYVLNALNRKGTIHINYKTRC